MNASPAARFGFLVHPLTQLQRRLLGVRAADVGLIAGRSPVWHGPVEIAHLRTTTALAGGVEGWLMALPSLPEALIEQQEDAVRDLAVAVRACADRGAQVVGLGALTALVGAHGRALEHIAAVPVTSGTALTSWAAVETLRLAERQGLRAPRTPVALLGLPGPAAVGITRLLVAQGHAVEVVVPAPPRAPDLCMSVYRTRPRVTSRGRSMPSIGRACGRDRRDAGCTLYAPRARASRPAWRVGRRS